MLSFLLLLAPVAALYTPGGEFIAVLKDPLLSAEYEATAPFAHAQSFRIGDKFQAYLYKNVSETSLTVLENLPFVKYVEENGQLSIAQGQDTQPNPPSWGIDRVSQRNLPLTNSYVYPSSAGEGVRVYIVDTGIYLAHNDFGGRAVFGITTNNDGGDADCNGHGTHVAGTAGGTAYGVAKKATLVHVKVLGCAGSGSFAQVIQGIDFTSRDLAEHGGGTGVINLSLGGGSSQTVNDAVDAATAGGILSSVAAGNDYGRDACLVSPAGAPTAYTVASSTNSDGGSSFTNLGTCVNVWAPGQNIVAPYIGSPTATRTLSGTSMAAPHVAGVAALIIADNRALTPAQVGARLTSTATPNVINHPSTTTPNLLVYNGVTTSTSA